MKYELTIENDKAKPVIAFLKQLDFVKVKAAKSIQKEATKSNTKLSYFGSCPDWKAEANELRSSSNIKRIKTW